VRRVSFVRPITVGRAPSALAGKERPMSTAASARPPANLVQSRAGAPAGGGVAIDPIRLLKKYYPLLIGAAFAGAIIGAAGHLILARVWPQYTSAATFACYPPSTDTTKINQYDMNQDSLNRFMGTQMVTMTSQPLLMKVLDESDVQNTRWARQYNYKGMLQKQYAEPELEKVISARAVPQTTLVRLSMTWRDPDDVRVIVEAATRVYLANLRSVASQESVGRRDVLGQQIIALDGQIKDLNARRDTLLTDGKVADIDAGLSELDIKTREFSERYVQTTSAYTNITSQWERYKKMQDENAVIKYPDNIYESANHDPNIQDLDRQISNYRTDYGALKRQGFGEEHPTVIAVKQRIDAANQERQEKYETTVKKLFDGEVDQLLSQSLSLKATQEQVATDLEEITKKKQDLTRIRIKLKDIDAEIKSKTEDRAAQDQARKQLEVLLTNPVFDRIQLVIPAQRPDTMTFPQWKIMIPLGVVLITGLTAGLVVLRELLDQRVRGPADLSTMARIRVLGIVSDAQEDPARPSNLPTAFRDAPTGVTAESFRLLRAPVIKAMDQAGHKTLLILAGMPGSGATTVATNLGLACAGADERVLIIDANLRRPGVQKAFGLADGPGLGDVLSGASTLDNAVRPTSAENLFVLTVGSSANRPMPERLASESMSRVLNEAKGKFDRIILDSAPAIVSGDGLTLANRVDAVALVVRAMGEKRGLVARLRNQLGECRGEFLGVVINAVRASAGGYLRGNIKATHEYQHGSQAA
jgi:polysaccharide biosynthesis transport protein